ncbi:hypothetical protein FACS1894172_02910 [Spirochaetia bacterium]|nr:hypothetical protein FACS1894172_02910 [Spirochaetia bacterium]
METIVLNTPRGTIKGTVFPDEETIRKEGYGIYFSDENYDVYAKPTEKLWCPKFGFVPR